MARGLSLGSLIVSLLLLSSFLFAGIHPNIAQSAPSTSTVTVTPPKAANQMTNTSATDTGQSQGSAVGPQSAMLGPGGGAVGALGGTAIPANESVVNGIHGASPTAGPYNFHIMAKDFSTTQCAYYSPTTRFLYNDAKAVAYFVAYLSGSWAVTFYSRSTSSRGLVIYGTAQNTVPSAGWYCVSAWMSISGQWPGQNYPRGWVAAAFLDGSNVFDQFFEVTDRTDFAFTTATDVDSPNGNPINPGHNPFVIGQDSRAYAFFKTYDAAMCAELPFTSMLDCLDTNGHIHDMRLIWYHGGTYDHDNQIYWYDYKNDNLNWNYWGWIAGWGWINLDQSMVGTWDVYLYLDMYWDNGNTWYGSIGHVQFTVQGNQFSYTLSNDGGISISQPGGSGSNHITATLTNGQSQLVSLSCTSGLPSGAQCNFNPQSGNPSFTSTLTITTTTSTPSGTSTITVTGTGDGQPSTSFQLTVTSPTTRTVTLTSTSTSWTTWWTTWTSIFTTVLTSTTWTATSSTSITTITTPTTTTATSFTTTTTTMPAVTVTTTSTSTVTTTVHTGGWIAVGGVTPSRPAACWFNDHLYMIVRDNGEDPQGSGIWMSIMDSNGQAGPWANIGGLTPSAPACTTFNNRLYLFVRDANGGLWMRSMDTGGTWSAWTALEGNSPSSPAAAAFNGYLYLAVRGGPPYQDAIWLNRMDTSESWKGWTQLAGLTPDSPSLAEFNNHLYMVVEDVSGGIWMRSMDTTEAWSSWSPLGGLTSAPPSMAAYGGELYLFVRDISGGIWSNTMDTSGTWSGWVSPGGLTMSGPVGCATNAGVYIVVNDINGGLWVRKLL